MPRFFNTAGTCLPDEHYMLPPERRLGEVRGLIDQGFFFVIHAPRQTGKTTFLNSLARSLNREGRYTAVVMSVEYLRRTTDVVQGNLSLIRGLLEDSQKSVPPAEQPPDPTGFMENPLRAFNDYLSAWAATCPKPIVLLIDEIDSLPEDLLISVLAQLRMGYTARPAPFIRSLALVGVRNVCSGAGSFFNVKSDSLTLASFTRDEVAELYTQHTSDTGQAFQPDAVDRAFGLAQGQPWCVNALAQHIIREVVPDRSQPITAAHMDAARETLILRRGTPLDALVEELRSPRVRRVIEPVLTGAVLALDVLTDDVPYVSDLGLVRTDPNIRIANPIYQELMLLTLSPGADVAACQPGVTPALASSPRPVRGASSHRAPR